jgi:hypothetical protein
MRFFCRTPVRTFIIYPVLVPAGSRRFNRTSRLYPQPHVPGPSIYLFGLSLTLQSWLGAVITDRRRIVVSAPSDRR